MRKGSYAILDDGQHVTSRIYVDDVAQIVFAAEQHAPAKAVYLVADDEPVTQRDTRAGCPSGWAWACRRRGRCRGRQGRVPHRNRRIRNARMKQELSSS